MMSLDLEKKNSMRKGLKPKKRRKKKGRGQGSERADYPSGNLFHPINYNQKDLSWCKTQEFLS